VLWSCVFVFDGGPIKKNQPPKEKECEGFDLSPLPLKLIIVILCLIMVLFYIINKFYI
jgi:hypothetical protein